MMAWQAMQTLATVGATDPGAAVPLVPTGGIEIALLSAAISSSFAFGVTNSALLFIRD